jgi:hypothetical protein
MKDRYLAMGWILVALCARSWRRRADRSAPRKARRSGVAYALAQNEARRAERDGSAAVLAGMSQRERFEAEYGAAHSNA